MHRVDSGNARKGHSHGSCAQERVVVDDAGHSIHDGDVVDCRDCDGEGDGDNDDDDGEGQGRENYDEEEEDHGADADDGEDDNTPSSICCVLGLRRLVPWR